jgi:hypothetical protein
LQREEETQRERADAAEKYKVQLENFIDMICHEIRNPYVNTLVALQQVLTCCRLNGIFGNVDLIFYYLQTIEGILQAQKNSPRKVNGIFPESTLMRCWLIG